MARKADVRQVADAALGDAVSFLDSVSYDVWPASARAYQKSDACDRDCLLVPSERAGAGFGHLRSDF